jgi:hypothetical protein
MSINQIPPELGDVYDLAHVYIKSLRLGASWANKRRANISTTVSIAILV